MYIVTTLGHGDDPWIADYLWGGPPAIHQQRASKVEIGSTLLLAVEQTVKLSVIFFLEAMMLMWRRCNVSLKP